MSYTVRCPVLRKTHLNEVYITANVYASPGVSDVLKAYQVAPDEVLVKRVSEKLLVYKLGQHHHT